MLIIYFLKLRFIQPTKTLMVGLIKERKTISEIFFKLKEKQKTYNEKLMNKHKSNKLK